METTHIRIPKDLKSRLDELSDPGESIGSVINRLVDNCLQKEPVNIDVNANVNNTVNTLLTQVNKEEVAILARKVEELETKLDQYSYLLHGSMQISPEDWDALLKRVTLLEKSAQDKNAISGPGKMVIPPPDVTRTDEPGPVPCPIQSEETIPADTQKKPSQKSDKPGPARIPITDEMREMMIEKIRTMKEEHDMTHAEIAKILMVPSIQRINELFKGILKTIPKDGYETLMSWTP